MQHNCLVTVVEAIATQQRSHLCSAVSSPSALHTSACSSGEGSRVSEPGDFCARACCEGTM